mmetsp:Transcript_18210/g.42382  ORF Transcript_18210/g.42382 Transcript_18210/m.42382 type:complete len:96 (-) Transcript_18210:190-477(-)
MNQLDQVFETLLEHEAPLVLVFFLLGWLTIRLRSGQQVNSSRQSAETANQVDGRPRLGESDAQVSRADVATKGRLRPSSPAAHEMGRVSSLQEAS